MQYKDIAFGFFIQWHAYLRPGEMLNLAVMHLVRPPTHGERVPWGLLLFPEEVGRPGRTQGSRLFTLTTRSKRFLPGQSVLRVEVLSKTR